MVSTGLFILRKVDYMIVLKIIAFFILILWVLIMSVGSIIGMLDKRKSKYDRIMNLFYVLLIISMIIINL